MNGESMNVAAENSVPMTKKESKVALANKQKTISQSQRSVVIALDDYKKAAKKLQKKANVNAKLQAASAAKPRNYGKRNKAELAQAAYDAQDAEVKAIAEDIRVKMEDIAAQYAELRELLTDKRKLVLKAETEESDFVQYVDVHKTKIENTYGIVFPEEAPVEEEPVEEEKKEEQAPAYPFPPYPYPPMYPPVYNIYQPAAPAPAPAAAAATETRPEVKVLPVNVDISKAVEKAVNTALARFASEFETKLNDYIASMPAPSGLSSATVKAYEMEVQVSEDEKFLMDKLGAMVENIKAINEKMLELNDAYADITDKQKEISEQQKKTNDIQRYTLREQQGVQVNQKVIGKDQIAVVEEQTAVAEQQKAAVERQQAILEAQTEVAKEQAMLIDAQGEISEAMKSIAAAQNDIVTAQENLTKSNNENMEAWKNVAEMQNDLNNQQKETANAQKALARDQKAVSEKQKAAEELQAGILDGLKTMLKDNKNLSDALERERAKLQKKADKKAEEKKTEEAPVAEPVTLESAEPVEAVEVETAPEA